MHCIVTAGPTYEPLDQVRRLTNFSTGQLGVDLANHLVRRGHRVTLLRGYYAVYRGEVRTDELISFTTTTDLKTRLQALAESSAAAVFHAAAVSDFAFGRVYVRQTSGELVEATSGKFSTRQGTLLAELVPTPKILAQLRRWFPQAFLVGWKYEVEGTQRDAIAAGEAQLRGTGTNACVVNGPAYGPGFALVKEKSDCRHAPNANTLFDMLSVELELR